jgi:hypothetical protein
MIQEAKKDKHGSNWPRVFWLLKLAGHVLYLLPVMECGRLILHFWWDGQS